MLLATFLSVSACDSLPDFPDVKTDLVDAANGKLHSYQLPKKRGEKAPFLGSRPASLSAINKNFCFAPREYSKIEEYISSLEDVASRRCN